MLRFSRCCFERMRLRTGTWHSSRFGGGVALTRRRRRCRCARCESLHQFVAHPAAKWRRRPATFDFILTGAGNDRDRESPMRGRPRLPPRRGALRPPLSQPKLTCSCFVLKLISALSGQGGADGGHDVDEVLLGKLDRGHRAAVKFARIARLLARRALRRRAE